MVIVGNQESKQAIQLAFRTASSNDKPLFLLLIGPNGIWKRSFILDYMKEELWTYFYTDFLRIRDCSEFLEKKHVLQVETPSTLKTIDTQDWTYENKGVREFTDWLSQSSFGGKKVLFIENIERMSNSAMNAFLKTAEEPLSQRFIFATLGSDKEILPTILSRAILVYFSPLSDTEIKEHFSTSLSAFSLELKDFLVLLAGWKPWALLNLIQKMLEDKNLFNDLYSLFTSLLNGGNIITQIAWMKKLEEIWLKDVFLDALIAKLVDLWKIDQAQNWISFKKFEKSNLTQENLFRYALLS